MPVLHGRCVLPSIWAVCLYQPRLESPASHLPDCSPAVVLAANCSQLCVVLHTLQGERSLVKTLSEHLLSVCAGCTSSRWSCPPQLKCQSQSPPHRVWTSHLCGSYTQSLNPQVFVVASFLTAALTTARHQTLALDFVLPKTPVSGFDPLH